MGGGRLLVAWLQIVHQARRSAATPTERRPRHLSEDRAEFAGGLVVGDGGGVEVVGPAGGGAFFAAHGAVERDDVLGESGGVAVAGGLEALQQGGAGAGAHFHRGGAHFGGGELAVGVQR